MSEEMYRFIPCSQATRAIITQHECESSSAQVQIIRKYGLFHSFKVIQRPGANRRLFQEVCAKADASFRYRGFIIFTIGLLLDAYLLFQKISGT